MPAKLPPRDLAEARAQDLDDLRLLPNLDRSFSPEAKAKFLEGIDAVQTQAAVMSPAQFEMAVSRLVALSGNGHTSVDKNQRGRLFGRAPVRFAWFVGGLYIVRVHWPAIDLLGRHVVSIDGRPVSEAFDAVRPYISGTEERVRDDSTPVLESPALLQAVWPDTDGEHLTLGLADGAVRQLDSLVPIFDPFTLQPVMAIASTGDDNWQTAVSRLPQTPLSLRMPEHMAFVSILGHGGLYVRINGNSNDPYGTLADQLARIAADPPKDGWRWVVLDLRFNNGGDELKTMAFTRSLPKLLAADGNLWILTGNATFSAAIITAARAKAFLGKRAHIVGETAGDRNPFWSGGGAPLVLRNSGIRVDHAYFKQDWSAGCDSIQLCSPFQLIYGVAAGDLTPEIKIGWSFSDYLAGQDTVLERVRDLNR